MKKVEKKAKSQKKGNLELVIRELEAQVPQGAQVAHSCARSYCE